MRAPKIIAFISFIINGLLSAFLLSSFLKERLIKPIPLGITFRFLIIPIIFAIGSLLYWLYLQKKEKKGQLVKFSLLFSFVLLLIPLLNFIIPLFSSLGTNSFLDFLATFQLGMLSFYTFGIPIILLILVISLILVFLPTKLYKNFFIQVISFLLIGIMILLLLANLILFFLAIYTFANLSKCGEPGFCGGWAISSFLAGLVGIVISSLFSFLLVTKIKKASKETIQ